MGSVMTGIARNFQWVVGLGIVPISGNVLGVCGLCRKIAAGQA
jgi:hypothetical protein